VFSDADMAGDIDGRRSTSSVIVFLVLTLISWLSLKQKVVALSTCEAEYVAGVLGLAAGLGEELLSNLLLPCMNARQEAGAKVSPAVTSSHCSSMTA